ncbi:sialidase [Apiospora arundinis]|uniref:Sialidase n=1 Tax=Apiospora arundinis TaxID=335852 RepID=A0ABR2IW98_9PEZI
MRMIYRKLAALIQTATLAAALTEDACLSAVSWSDPRVDLFGVAEDSSIWHKFYTGYDWQPAEKFEYLPSQAKGCPSVTSWGEGRLDIVYVNSSGGNVMHKYFGGGHWGPSWEGADDLGGHHHHIEAVKSMSWGENRLDIVGRTKNGSYVHKAWTGKDWFPSGDKWEHFGGEFFSDPAIVSWSEGRLDVIGLAANASLMHKYYNHGKHGGEWSAWEDLKGPGFIGNPQATSWGPDRMDFWGIDSSDGALHHLYWDGKKYQPSPDQWENLGGEFTDTPRIVHWKPDHVDAVGKSLDDGKLRIKNFDGGRWNPSEEEWWSLAGPFVSEPALLAKHNTNFLYIFGIDEGNDVRMQIWSGSSWEPAADQTWSIGKYSKSEEGSSFQEYQDQSVLQGAEL